MTLDQNQVRKVFLEGLRFCKWLLYSGATGLLVGGGGGRLPPGYRLGGRSCGGSTPGSCIFSPWAASPLCCCTA